MVPAYCTLTTVYLSVGILLIHHSDIHLPAVFTILLPEVMSKHILITSDIPYNSLPQIQADPASGVNYIGGPI